ncbi:hypothetical protein UCREL1_11235 [Eutypa lata UCREL1]|uniref:Uncharacterized protein n=1 Tax=Eutypa lata (strain UCR-EL1) TaxID=1287681 RepID=M7SCD2_EUTLA|nr:hypothetical protein UCREL1_11235 [Eutypa lata UCREL1]
MARDTILALHDVAARHAALNAPGIANATANANITVTDGIGTTLGIILEIEVEIKTGFETTTLINDLESAVSLLTDPREVQETAPMDYDERMTDIGDLRTEAAQEVSHLVLATVRATLKIKLGARRAHRRQ